jgi:B12-binding domain/radical SAM domain protein
MSAPHLVLLHPPSVMDFRERPYRHWPMCNTVATSPVFEYFPLGFITLMSHLERNGFTVRIINLAAKMVKSKRFQPEALLRKLKPLAFGIGLHWAAHADGAMELAALCKRLHPEIPVILGGLTASYFHEEIIRQAEVDYVLRGDSTEGPLLELMRVLEKGGSPRDVPNLTWNENGETRINPLSYQPELLDIRVDYPLLRQHMLRDRDLRGNLLTGYHWPVYCFNLILWCRGCKFRCVTCGGNNWALGRKALAYRDAEAVAEELAVTQGMTFFHVGLPGDVRMGDWRRLFAAIKQRRIRRAPGLELFAAGGDEFLREAASLGAAPELAMSPESHDENIRRAYGRCFSNEMLEKDIAAFLGMGGKVRLFFMAGLPMQTAESVRRTLEYCARLFDRFSKYPAHFDITFAPLAPFVDPGAPAFEFPEAHGYRIFTRSFADHRKAMRELHWKDVLGYETEAMEKAEIAEVSLEAAERLCHLRRQFGSLRPKHAEEYLRELGENRG